MSTPIGNSVGLKAIAGFKAYDLRGRIPDELNEDVAYRVGRGYAQFLSARRVVVGRDIRLSSASLTDALCRGLTDSGVDVDDIGVCGTEGVYFATFDGGYDGGIMVTASHNPSDYNGMKFVREQSKPISGDNGLQQIRGFAERGEFPVSANRGVRRTVDITAAYVAHLLSYVDVNKLRPLKIVVNAGNGGAGLVIDQLEPHLPFNFIKVHHEPDGRFPNGIPNPMLEENRASTSEAIRAARADFGIAWDGDFDRCFLFDECGSFIEGYYIVGLLASVLLRGDAPRQGRPRSAPDLEHDRGRRGLRRPNGALQIRPRVHQTAHARGRCGLRRGDERAPLFSPLLLLRQRHDSVADRRSAAERIRGAALGARR